MGSAVSNFFTPTTGSAVQIEPVGLAGASGFQDIKCRNFTTTGTVLIAGTITANSSLSFTPAGVNLFIDMASGAGAAVSGAATGRLIYNNAAGAFQISVQGGAYASIVTGAQTLQAAYNGGQTIAESGGNPVALSSTTADNANVLTVTKNPAGAQSGSGVLVTMGATTTGAGITVSQTAGATGLSFLGSSVGTGISCPGVGTNSERFGNGSSAAGNQSVAIGNATSAAGTNCISIGYSNSNNGNNAIILASGGNVGANQFVAGSDNMHITSVYFGNGSGGSGAPTNYTISGCPSAQNGSSGGNISAAGGLANQASDPGGNVALQTAVSGAGTTLVNRAIYNATTKALTSGTATALCKITLASNTMGGLVLRGTVRCTDGTDMQSNTFSVLLSATNKAGAMAGNSVMVNSVPTTSAGTLVVTTDTSTGAGLVNLRITATSAGLGAITTFDVCYVVENHSVGQDAAVL